MYGLTTETPGPGVYETARAGDGTFASVCMNDPPAEVTALVSKLRLIRYRIARILRSETDSVANRLEKSQLPSLQEKERQISERLAKLAYDLPQFSDTFGSDASSPSSRPPTRGSASTRPFTPAGSLLLSSIPNIDLPRPNTAATSFSSKTTRFSSYPYRSRPVTADLTYDLGETGGAFASAQPPPPGKVWREPMKGSKLPHFTALSATTTGLLATTLSKHKLGPGQYEPPITQYVGYRPRLGTRSILGDSSRPEITVPVPSSVPRAVVPDRWKVVLPERKLPYKTYLAKQGKRLAMKKSALAKTGDVALVEGLEAWAKSRVDSEPQDRRRRR